MKANSCYFNLILATYKEAIERVHGKGERAYKDLTADKLCEIMGIGNFFKKFQFQLGLL